MEELIEVLNCVSAGTALKWLIGIFGGLGVFGAATIKVYQLLEKYRKARNCEDEKNETIKEHTKNIQELRVDIQKLMDFNTAMVEVNKIQTRNDIVRICNEALDRGCIDSIQLQALEDSYDMYVNILHGNSYVSSLVAATRRLQVSFRGNLHDDE